MQRRSTDFAGWQREVDFLASEAERQKAAEKQAYTALAQREAKIPYNRNRLWQAAMICFGTVLAALLALHWWLDGILRSIGL